MRKIQEFPHSSQGLYYSQRKETRFSDRTLLLRSLYVGEKPRLLYRIFDYISFVPDFSSV
jgi:hypothetical protein